MRRIHLTTIAFLFPVLSTACSTPGEPDVTIAPAQHRSDFLAEDLEHWFASPDPVVVEASLDNTVEGTTTVEHELRHGDGVRLELALDAETLATLESGEVVSLLFAPAEIHGAFGHFSDPDRPEHGEIRAIEHDELAGYMLAGHRTMCAARQFEAVARVATPAGDQDTPVGIGLMAAAGGGGDGCPLFRPSECDDDECSYTVSIWGIEATVDGRCEVVTVPVGGGVRTCPCNPF